MNHSFAKFSKVIIVGCGYTGRRLASSIDSASCEVVAVTHRSDPSMDSIQSIKEDFDRLVSAQVSVDQDSLIYYLVPPQKYRQRDLRIRRVLNEFLVGIPRKLVLISTTGVYGDCQGQWVNEKTPLKPVSDTAKRRQDAEIYTKKWAKKSRVQLAILRVAGIYGPDRIPIARLQRGFVLPARENVGYTNRIHVDDLIRVCQRVAHYVEDCIFNVADGHPMRINDYYNLVAKIWGLPRVQESSDPCELQHISERMWEFLKASKRIDNRNLLKTLGIQLRYPNPKLGLQACYKTMNQHR